MAKKLLRFVCFLFIPGVFSVSLAQNPVPQSAVILSEVFYDIDGSDNELEWVELYNQGNSAIDLSNYSLGNAGENYTYSTVQLSGTVEALSFFVVGGPTSNESNYFPTFDLAIDFSPDFQNVSDTTADGVALFDVPAAEVDSLTVPIDVVIYGKRNMNGLINSLGVVGEVDVEDAPKGSSVERFSLDPNLWQVQNSPNPNQSPFQSALPVELSSFYAQYSNGTIILNWTTETENSNYGFFIYRGENKTANFIRLNEDAIPGAGTSAILKNYSFIDKNISAGKLYYYKLCQTDYNGGSNFYGPVQIFTSTTVVNYDLFQNYPNPFNPVTHIAFQIPTDDRVELKIYDQLGREVATLMNKFCSAGKHEIVWNGKNNRNIAQVSGVYFYRIKTGNYEFSRKMILTK